MTQLRLARYRELGKVAERVGFMWVRRDGSHDTFRNAQDRIVVFPNHGSRPSGRGLLTKIVRQLELSPDKFHRILDA